MAARGTPHFCYLAHRSRHILSSVSVDGGAVGIEIGSALLRVSP
jgi:hypothetical protein